MGGFGRAAAVMSGDSVVRGGVLLWLLKYNLDVILYHKGRKANPTKSFAIFALFAPFAVNQIMKPSPHPFSFRPFAFTSQGARFGLLRLPFW